MNIRNAQIEDINKISKLMLQVAEIHSNARKDIFKEKSIEEMRLNKEEARKNAAEADKAKKRPAAK